MARPIKLIKKEVITKAIEQIKTGLSKQALSDSLRVSYGTLNSRIQSYNLYLELLSSNPDVANEIYNNLFPDFFTDRAPSILNVDGKNFSFAGTFPRGKWFNIYGKNIIEEGRLD